MAKENNKNFTKKNTRNKFQKREKNKPNKFSMAKQLEKRGIPLPKTWDEWGGHRGLIEYHMGKEMAEDILDLRKGKEKGIDPQLWLCNYVNEELHLIGYCTKVIIGAV